MDFLQMADGLGGKEARDRMSPHVKLQRKDGLGAGRGDALTVHRPEVGTKALISLLGEESVRGGGESATRHGGIEDRDQKGARTVQSGSKAAIMRKFAARPPPEGGVHSQIPLICEGQGRPVED